MIDPAPSQGIGPNQRVIPAVEAEGHLGLAEPDTCCVAVPLEARAHHPDSEVGGGGESSNPSRMS